MKKIVFKVLAFIICFLLLFSCEKSLTEVEKWNELQRNFYGYNVKDRIGIDIESVKYSTCLGDSVFLTGFRNGKIWIAMFNGQTKEQLQEWNGTKAVDREVEFDLDLGYGEHKIVELKINCFDLISLKKTTWGYVFILRFLQIDLGSIPTLHADNHIEKEVVFLKDNNLIQIPTEMYPSIISNCWYQESIIIKGKSPVKFIVLSSEGKAVATLQEAPCRNDYIFEPLPISYKEGINFTRDRDWIDDQQVHRYACRYDYSTKEIVWKTFIPSLTNTTYNTRETLTLIENSGKQWQFQYDITNIDGSKQQSIFTINMDSGELIEK